MLAHNELPQKRQGESYDYKLLGNYPERGKSNDANQDRRRIEEKEVVPGPSPEQDDD